MGSNKVSSEQVYFSERGAGSPLLLIHGLMMTGEMFEERVIDHFEVRHRVIVPDLRGHGRSRGLPPPYTAEQLASDLARLLDHLGIESAAILGYSHGGAIAQQLVLDYPNLCARLVLASTYAFNMATTREQLEGHLMLPLLRVLGMKRLANLGISRSNLRLDRERAERFARPMAGQDLKLMLIATKEMMAFDSRKRLAEIHCPTLVIAGSNDQAVPSHHARMLHEGIAGSQLVIIDGADHALIWTHTDMFLQVIDEFIKA